MTLTDLASLGSLASGIAVLISLLYLAAQVKQATKHTRAQISQNRISRMADQQMRLAEGELGGIVGRGRRGDGAMSADEIGRFMAFMRAQFWSAEDNFLQHREQMLADEMFASFRASMTGLMRGAGTQAAWELSRESFVPEFRAFMDDVAKDARAAGFNDLAAPWNDAVARFKAQQATT
ncbi:MAG: hypothetical protein JSR60_04320 [Proteobacteria bacterium]|nr:hypothetical protein [Pseudomonadota bacterium]